jgi:hypothetical protein
MPARSSVVDAYRRRHSFKMAMSERRYAMRCWLASFVFHLALVIGLASLLLPQLKMPARPLLMSFAATWSDAAQSPPVAQLKSFEIEPPEDLADAEALNLQLPPPVPPEKPEVEVEPVNEPKPPAEEQVNPPPQVSTEIAIQNAPASVEQALPRMASPRPLGAAQAGFRSASLSSGALAGPASEDLPADDLAQQQMDHIVEQFIRYDIGQLPGAAGQRARRAFDQLGPEAIPALVRGLNRSASIHASCPVCVISSKLQNSLGQCRDPRLLQYAIANIGLEVPAAAPHRSRLENLVKSLMSSATALEEGLASADRTERIAAIERILNQHAALSAKEKLQLSEPLIELMESGDEQLALAAHRLMALMTPSLLPPPAERTLNRDPKLAVQQWRDHWRRVAQALSLERERYDGLALALASEDLFERQAAALVIARFGTRFSDGQKLLLARRLLELLSAGDAESHQSAQAALIRLASADEDVATAWTLPRWRAYWDRYERSKLLIPRATSYLSMASLLESRGQRSAAAERYRKLVAEYPGTPPAEEAQRRLARLTSQP